MSWEDEDIDDRLDKLDRRFKAAGFSDEDEDDDDVKDAWDADSDEEKEKKDAAKPAAAAAAKPAKKKTIKQIAAEKEAKAKAEAEARRKVHAQAANFVGEELGDPEAEKARRQRLVEEADLENAKELFDDAPKPAKKLEGVPIESMQPKTRADFEGFAKAISDKLVQFENAPLYTHCLELLFKDAVANMNFEDIRKLSAALNVIANQKQQADKLKKAGGGKKKKGGATIQKVGKDDAADQIDSYGGGRYEDSFDDFI